MRLIRSCRTMQALAWQWRLAGHRIAVVPTMGCLHEGHLSLIRRARQWGDVVVVTLFVNPLQFGPREDFRQYPRNLRRDARLCRREGVDVLFCPEASEMYAPDHSTFVEETQLSARWCGASRPGHFRGVATVVAKLFHLTCPNVAVFGRKDFQQARVIERMVRDLNFPVRIVTAPTVREPDGLALSSRNLYLSAEERREACRLSESLRWARRQVAAGARDARRIRAGVVRHLRRGARLRVDYVAVVDDRTLEPVRRVGRHSRLLLAAWVGRTRLIDNAPLMGRWE